VAFTASGTNPTKYQGTTNVDVLVKTPQDNNYIVYADKGNDAIDINSSTKSEITNASVYGQDGADKIEGESTKFISSHMQGGKGNDTITFGEFNSSRIYGGKDNDTISVTRLVDSTVQGSDGTDKIGTADVGFKVLNSAVYGGADNDSIYVGTLTGATVQGSLGSDTIQMATGDAILSKINGGGDNDSITIDSNVGEINKGSTLNGNKGADRITVETSVIIDEITVFGGSGNDNITITDSQTTISGDKGEDTIDSGTGTKVSVSGGIAGDTITLKGDTGTTQTVNGDEGVDTIVLGTTNSAGGATVMQGRTDSAAATLISGNSAGGDLITLEQTITFGGEVDVITDYVSSTDSLGLELTTSSTNISYFGATPTADATSVSYKDLVAGTTLEWQSTMDAGQTTVISGTFSETADTFVIGNEDTDNDLLVIQGNGSAITANTSMVVIVNAGTDTANTANSQFAAFGATTASAALTEYVNYIA
jgi:hypothetical protein